MKYKKRNTFDRDVFRMNEIIENCSVKEMLSCNTIESSLSVMIEFIYLSGN